MKISHERYRWAIERAGLDVDSYIQTHSSFPLADWMSGAKCPTLKQLEAFAKSVNLPFGYLFLDNVPEEKVPFPVFRGDSGKYDHFDLNVYDTVLDVKRRQEWLADYLVENEIEICSIVRSIDLNTPIAEAVQKLREILNLQPQWAFELDENRAIKTLTDKLEQCGIFVAYNGIVGNNTHRQLNVKECRGFALVNDVAPYIFVNSADAPTAQLFTLIHETVHILLGISAGHTEDNARNISNEKEENFCDRVSAEFLVPEAEIRPLFNGDIKKCARKFCVSEIVIARRLHDLKIISDRDYNEFWSEYSARSYKKRGSAGGDFYRTSIKRVGRLFAIHVRNALNNEQLSYIEAYRLTGLYGKTYEKLMNTI